MGIPKEIDVDAMHLYFRLNYLPPDVSIFKNVKKLKPGTYLFFPVKKAEAVTENILQHSIFFIEPHLL